MHVMGMYFVGVSKTFNNVSKRNDPFNRSKNGKMAFYVLPSGSLNKKRVSSFKFYLYKYFKPRFKRRIAWCTNCENKFQAICKNEKVISECPNCEE